MMNKNVKRNSNHKSPTQEGVGGRHIDPGIPTKGGGYLDDCAILEFPVKPEKTDPRLDELSLLNLKQPWLQIARAIGFDNFLTVWKILDQSDFVEEHGGLRVRLPRFAKYIKYQRNRWIKSLAIEGMNVNTIKTLVDGELKQQLSGTQISRIIDSHEERPTRNLTTDH